MPHDMSRKSLEERMATALRRAGGIPKLARTPEGRAFLLKTCAAEALTPPDHPTGEERDNALLDQALTLKAQVDAARTTLDMHEAAYLPVEARDDQRGAFAGGVVKVVREVRKAMDAARSTAALTPPLRSAPGGIEGGMDSDYHGEEPA